MAERDSFVFYRSFYEAIRELDEEDRLKVYDAIASYSLNHEVEELSGVPKAIFTLIKPQVDANYGKYLNGCKGGKVVKKNQDETESKPKPNQDVTELGANENVNVNVNDNVNDLKENTKEKAKRFSKPSIEEIEQYCADRGNFINAENFYNFYESKGWKVGNSPMKDWKACVRTWEQRNKTNKPSSDKATPDDFRQYDPGKYDSQNNRQMTDEEIDELLRGV